MTETLPATIATLMNSEPMVIDPDDPLDLAESILKTSNSRHWPVARNHSLLGIVSLRDLFTARLPEWQPAPNGQTPELKTGHVMTHARVVAHPDDDLAKAAALMNRYRLSCLPVVERDELVGIITLNHMVDYAVKLLREEEAAAGFAPTVTRLMTRAPLAEVQLLDRVDVAELIMRQFNVRHLVVMNGERLIGIISDRDILAVMRSSIEPASAVLVGEIMTQYPITVAPNAEAAAAGTALVKEKIGALPVMYDGKLAGILSKSDFLRYVAAVAPNGVRPRIGQWRGNRTNG
jgi:CBS domain-containing protein